MKVPAFFLDRDGTINIDRVYINDPRLIELIPGAAEGIGIAKEAGFKIVVVTNQSGIGRGIIAPQVLPQIHERLDELLTQEIGTAIDRYEICTHHPREECECRKPKIKLVRQAAEELGIDIARSIFVGDKLSDVATGKNAGCIYSILVRTGKGAQEEVILRLAGKELQGNEVPDYVASDLRDAVKWVLLKLAH